MKVIRLLIAVAALAGISQSAQAAEMFKLVSASSAATSKALAKKAKQVAQKETAAQEAERLANDIVKINAKHMTTATTCPELFVNAKEEAFDRLTALVQNRDVQTAILTAYIKEAAAQLSLETNNSKLIAIAAKISTAYITDKKATDIAWNYMRLMYRNQQAELRKKNAATDNVPALLGTTAANTTKYVVNTTRHAFGYAVNKADNALSTTWGETAARGIATAVLWKNKNSTMNIPVIGIKSPASINKVAFGALMAYNIYKSIAYKNGFLNQFLHAYNNALTPTTTAVIETIGGTPDYAAMLS